MGNEWDFLLGFACGALCAFAGVVLVLLDIRRKQNTRLSVDHLKYRRRLH